MSNEKTIIEQLHKELAETQIDKTLAQQSNTACMQETVALHAHLAAAVAARDALARGCNRQAETMQQEAVRVGALLEKTSIELTDACIMRDALADEANELEESRDYNASLVIERDEKLAQMNNELDAIDEALGEFCYQDSEDHGVYAMRQNLDRARSVIAARNAALTQALNERDETEANLNHVRKLWHNPAEVAQMRAELVQLQKRLTATVQRCGYCDYEATGANAFNLVAEHIKTCPKHPLAGALAELAQAHKYTTRMVRLVAERDIKLAQICTELKDLQGANRSFGQQLAAVKENRDYWYETCLSAESKHSGALQEAQAQSDEVQRDWLSPVEAKGLRRQLADAELAAHIHDKACGELAQTARTERQLRQEAEKRTAETHEWLAASHRRANEAARQLGRAEALAQLVNEGTAVLLERLAGCAHMAGQSRNEKAADALAAQIREALDDSQA